MGYQPKDWLKKNNQRTRSNSDDRRQFNVDSWIQKNNTSVQEIVESLP
jgi:hypothetical protein